MAGTVIDSLIVTLGLNDADYKKGVAGATDANKKLRDDSAKTAKEVSEPNKVVADSFGRIKTELLGLLAVAAGGTGLKDILAHVINLDASTGRLAYNIGIATSQLSAWGNMARNVGGDANATMNSILGISQAMTLQQMGMPQTSIAAMQGHGIRFTGQDGRPLDMSDILLQISDLFHKLTPQQDTALGSIFGLDQGTVNLLETQTPAQLKAGLLSQTSVNSQEAADAQKIQAQFGKLETALDSLGGDVLVTLTPAILDLTQWLTYLVNFLHAGPKNPSPDAPGQNQVPPGAVTGSRFQARTGQIGTVSADQQSVEDQTRTALLGAGFTPVQAAGVQANEGIESSFNPNATSPDGSHKGLFQWDETRRASILAGRGIDVWTAGTSDQIAAMIWELNHTESKAGAALRAQNTSFGAGVSFDNTYERSGDGLFGQATRGNYAQQIAGQYAASLPPSVTKVLSSLRAKQGNATVTTVGDITINVPPGTPVNPTTLTTGIKSKIHSGALIPSANGALN